MALLSAWISSSQPLHEPASTSRIERLRPKRRRAARSTLAPNSASISSSLTGAASVTGRRIRVSNKILRMPVILEIVTGIRAVERFVAQWEVRDDIALDRSFQQRPLKPGRIAQVTTRDPAAFESHPYQHITAKRFRHSETFAHLAIGIDRDPHRACGQTSQDLIYQGEALLDLPDAHISTFIAASTA